MKVVALATQKGGAGKTTLCGHLAVEAESKGEGPVALIDADPQGSLAAWWNDRQAPTPVMVTIGAGGLRGTLRQLRAGGFKLAFIDTPGRADKAIAEIISHADLVLVPVVPSPHDLRAIQQTVEVVEQANIPAVFIVNNAGAGRLTGQAAVALSQHGTVAPVMCKTRQDFRVAMINGRTAAELDPRGRSAGEIAELWSYLTKLLKRERRRG